MRDRWTTVTLIAVTAAAVGTVAFALPASAGLVTSCVGTAADVTVPNDLFVPAGSSCELTNVTINGNTTVRAGANLVLRGSTLNGSLTLQRDAFADIGGSTVSGVTRLNSAFGAFAENGLLSNVHATDSGFVYGIGATVNSVTSTNGETYLESVRLNRNLTTAGDLLTDVYNSVIRGAVDVTGATMGSVFCASEIDGDTAVSASGLVAGSALQIGASAPLSGCAFNVFGADLALTDNAAPIYLSDNVVRGSLVCTGNSTAPVGSSGRIRGAATGQCAPGASAAGGAIARAGTTASRTADVRSRIRSRTAAGADAAARAGPAAFAGNR
jgi:hypothetical protein